MGKEKTHPVNARVLSAVLAVSLALSACGPVEEFRERLRDLTPHESYLASLQAAGLGESALAERWTEAAALALSNAPEVGLPYQEEGYLFPETPEARSYRVRLRRGQQLTIDVSLTEEAPTRLFVDLYRLRDGRDPTPMFSTDSVLTDIEFVAGREAEYVLRIQPELLRGGQFRVSLRVDASMTFPVENHDTRAIQSRFGVERDGGRRSHHGVDIFARRNTPVLSATDGIVSNVDTTNLGGYVVWVRDSRSRASIYYAHLETQLVEEGARVQRGQPVGRVGNSGNARTTPPHLHFGIYARGEGPVDPFYYLLQPERPLEELTAPLGILGEWTRTRDADIRLRSGPSRRSEVVESLPRHTALRVVAATGSWYRVRLPDGRGGYVAARLMEVARDPLTRETLAYDASIQAAPSPDSPRVEQVASGASLEVFGRFADYYYVRTSDGHPGWLPVQAADADADRD